MNQTEPVLVDFVLSNEDFDLFRRLVYSQTGIALGPHKRHLLRARLGRRLRALGLSRFVDYYDHLTANPSEMENFVNAITTNKTDFFREAHHFEHLLDHWAPGLHAKATRTGRRRVRVWSASCSSGEEAYTLAMMLAEARLVPPSWDTRILASDIDTDMLAATAKAVYPMERVTPVPQELLTRYFVRNRGAEEVRVRPELRKLCTVRQINLADTPWPIRTTFDVIFCRNTLIYFDRIVQKRVLEAFVSFLDPGGLLFLGHAESIFGLVDGLAHLGNTIYQRIPIAAQGGRP